ncbi:MAG TPA: Flp pilus assembly protein CpaB [bacterium]|nr:Flp pilus assembly protein CpaB [Candidatus Omnitrophota bacterium]HOJ62531.1 Flp pilus assembly protein CpaB [bacterium]HOL95301.1 Flp pilus assembly protein CpaB [bacterium]HPP02790.1 Flp pilus assembly protein CpaB [bacterium]
MSKGAAFFLLLVAVISGAVATAAVRNYLQSNIAAQQTGAAPPMAQVVVAKFKIPAGTAIKPEYLVVTELPAKAIPMNAFKTMEKLEGRVVNSDIYPGEVVLSSRLEPEGAQAGLSALIPKGMRAITLKVDDTTGVAGFVKPGNYVDVVTTIRSAEVQEGAISKVVLQNVKVIATGEQVEVNPQDAKQSRKVPTVTVLVTLEQVERLSLATTQGLMRLVLRNQTDTSEEQTMGATLSKLIPMANEDPSPPREVVAAPVVEAPAPTPTPKPRPVRTVQLLSGNSVKEFTFQE